MFNINLNKKCYKLDQLTISFSFSLHMFLVTTIVRKPLFYNLFLLVRLWEQEFFSSQNTTILIFQSH